MVGHCRDTWWLGAAGVLIGWALQGYSLVGHCRDTWWLATAGILGGWPLNSASSRARTTSTLKSNNPTARVGNNTKTLAASMCGQCHFLCIQHNTDSCTCLATMLPCHSELLLNLVAIETCRWEVVTRGMEPTLVRLQALSRRATSLPRQGGKSQRTYYLLQRLYLFLHCAFLQEEVPSLYQTRPPLIREFLRRSRAFANFAVKEHRPHTWVGLPDSWLGKTHP